MRIGELAALAGVSTRTVRHYHHLGLLPEPPRRANGYREYGLRDAVELARMRRLAELGLGLEEVRDIVADDAGRELHEVLAELDADLARQEQAIRERRERLAELLRQARDGKLPAEGPVSPELAALFAEMARVSATRPGPEPAMAVMERELFAMLDASAAPEQRGWVLGLMRSIVGDPAAAARAYEVYVLMDELATARTDDPRIEQAARAIADSVPDEVLEPLLIGAGVLSFRAKPREREEEPCRAAAPGDGTDGGAGGRTGAGGAGTGAGDGGPEGRAGAGAGAGTTGTGTVATRPGAGAGWGRSAGAAFEDALFAELTPAQAEVVRRAMTALTERAAKER